MAKSSGLGDNCYVDGNDLSGDIGSLGTIGSPLALLDVTAINKSAHERIGGRRDGKLEFTAFWNSTGEHPVLSTLPTSDRICSYLRGTGIGSPIASMVAKQIDYPWNRSADGALTAKVEALANGYGLEWGVQLTAGIRTDTATTNGASWTNPAGALAFGAQAYLHVFGFTGTDATVKLQDSADNVTFTDIAGAAFTQITAAPGAQRLALANTATVRQYVRAVTVTTGGFTSLAFAVQITVNPIAGVVF